MAIDPAALRDWPFAAISQSYDEKDAILYALGLGIGQDPLDPLQLQFVYEVDLRTLPTMSVVLGFPGPWLSDPATGIDYSRVVHGEQHLEIVRPLPVAGTMHCVNRVVDVADRGSGKGAAITVGRELIDESNGQLLARQRSVLIARGDGGFGGNPACQSRSRLSTPPVRDPDLHFEWRVPPQLALVYRLSGDRNPLHADPGTAQRAGFDRPILHGLASFGIAGFAAILTLCNGNPDGLREIGARFSAPVIPGDTLMFDVWNVAPGEAAFRAGAVERDRIVLDNGRVRHSA